MKVLHREIEGCMSCPYMVIGGEKDETIIGCKNREALVGCNAFNTRVILRQPASYVVAEVVIPEWCPLPDGDTGQ